MWWTSYYNVKQVNIPNSSNSCSALDNSFGWSFFDLNAIQDEHKDESVTVLQADFVSIRISSPSTGL